MERTHILTFGKTVMAFCMKCCRETNHTCTSDPWTDDDGDRLMTVLCQKCGQHGYIALREDEDEG